MLAPIDPMNGIYYHLGTETTPGGSTVITNGYCNNDFTNYSETIDAGLSPYPCPVNQVSTQEDLNTSTMLIETLNEGLDAVKTAVSGDDQFVSDIDEYKTEIDGDANGDITVSELQTYLQSL